MAEEDTTHHYLRGHRVEVKAGAPPRYADTGGLVSEDPERPCNHCMQPPTSEGYDACLGYLPGVSAACCGHGNRRAYIRFVNGTMVELTEATASVLRKGRGSMEQTRDDPQQDDWIP